MYIILNIVFLPKHLKKFKKRTVCKDWYLTSKLISKGTPITAYSQVIQMAMVAQSEDAFIKGA